MKPLKISYVIPLYWPMIGGSELHSHELISRMSLKHEVKVYTLMNRQDDKQKGGELWFACVLSAPSKKDIYHDANAEVIKIPLTRYEKCIAYPFVRSVRPALPGFLRNLALESLIRFYKKRLDDYIGDCHIIHGVHGAVSWIGYAALLVARKRNIPFVYTPVSHLYLKEKVIQDFYADNKPPAITDLDFTPRGPVTTDWLRTCYEADALIAMTNYERRFFTENSINRNVHTTGVGPVVTDVHDMHFKQNYGLENKKIVLFLGRNNRTKGIPELLSATRLVWDQCPDTVFFFAGPLEGDIKQLFDAHADPRIIVAGALDLGSKSAALDACDILCVPSTLESLGGIYLEAWYFQKPVIAADIPPVRELMENGKGGLLVKPLPEHIAGAILRLLNNPGQREKMGKWGRNKVITEYGWDMITEKVENIYLSLRS